jgi:hypothetical protein
MLSVVFLILRDVFLPNVIMLNVVAPIVALLANLYSLE